MSFIAKLWLTLTVLLPLSLGLWLVDDGESVLTFVAITEILLWFGILLYAVIAYIWAH